MCVCMATLLLVDGVSWGNHQTGAPSFLSSLQRPDFSVPPCSCNRHCEPSTSTSTSTSTLATTRCLSSNSLIDRLDPPLPRFPNHHQSIKASEVSRYRVILENKSNRNQSYVDESLTTSKEPSISEPWNNLEQPSSPGNGDTSNIATSYTDLDMRRSRRISPSYLSVSRSRRAMANGATLQAAPTPFQYKDFKGPSGFYVGFTAIILGLIAVLQKGGLLGINSSRTTLCSKCDGYGMKPCNLCKGRGSITWEGKLKHTDLCPSCFGARIRKCSDCGGYRMRSDEPPFLYLLSKSSSSKARP